MRNINAPIIFEEITILLNKLFCLMLISDYAKYKMFVKLKFQNYGVDCRRLRRT